MLVGCGPSMSIHDAAWDGNIEVVKQHIAAGTDVNAKTDFEDTPLDWAIEKKHTEIADLLRKHSVKTRHELKAEESIRAADYDGNIEAVKQHLAAGTDVNAKAEDGWTPLHHVALKGHKGIIELLIANGAEVNAKNNDGGTPLDMAIQMSMKPELRDRSAETADLLRKHGGKTSEELKAEGIDNTDHQNKTE